MPSILHRASSTSLDQRYQANPAAHWRFADAGPGARRSTFMGRHPQTFTDRDMIHIGLAATATELPRPIHAMTKAQDLRSSFGRKRMTGVLDDYMVDPDVSLLDKTRIQAQVLVPVLRALRAELGKDKADAIVKQALRDWSRQLFAEIGDGIEGSPRRKWATMQSVWARSRAGRSRSRCCAMTRRRWNST